MKKKKVAHGKRRNFKASSRPSKSEIARTKMRKAPGKRRFTQSAENSAAAFANAMVASASQDGSTQNGGIPSQTAIVDLTPRHPAAEARFEALRQQEALYELSQRHQKARNLEEIFGAALDAISAALLCERASILLSDQQQVMRFVAWRGISEKYRKAAEGHSPWKAEAKNPGPIFISDVDMADLPKSLKSAIRKEGIRAAGFIPLVSGGRLIGKFMTYHSAPHVFTENERKLAITIGRQLALAIETERTEAALRESEARMRAIVEQTAAGMARCDANGRLIFANRRLCKMLGYTKPELIGKTIAEMTHPDDVDKNTRLFRGLIRNGKPYRIEKRLIRRGGSALWVDVSATAVRGADGKTHSALAVIIDITDRKKTETALQRTKALLELRVRVRTRELHEANKELQSEIARRKGLEGEILSVSDREQQRLGQELHDGLCQHLTAVAFMTRSMALRLRNHRVVDADEIDKIAELVNNAAADTRELSRALHRIDVDAVGLSDALQDLVDREIWKTPCQLEVHPSFHLEDDTVAAQVYRIAREAVINANKHARARRISVKLERSGRGMVLHVIDDGMGFPEAENAKQGLGCHIMNYRARLIGGRLEIKSGKQRGTRLSCYFPNGLHESQKAGRNGETERVQGKVTQAFGSLV